MKNQNRKSSSKAVSAGVFIALYLVTYVVIGAICMPIPILFLLMPMLVAFFAAPTYHMLLAKSPSGLSIFIACVLPSLVLIATGHNPIAPLVSVPAGLLAVLVAKRGEYRDFRWNMRSHLLFSLNLFGGFLPIWLMRDAFFASVVNGGLTQEFANSVQAMTPFWVLPAMILCTMLFSYLGSLVTKKVLAKRLKNAGVL